MLSEHFSSIKDNRQSGKIKHTLHVHDCMMSGFAMMFYQDPALLQFQKRLQETVHTNNLYPLFKVQSIPKDTQMRDVIDEVDSREFEPLFEYLGVSP
jgi:hypothetical protein